MPTTLDAPAVHVPAIEAPLLRLRILPPGLPAIETDLPFERVKTRTDDPLCGDSSDPWAARTFRAPGSPWGVLLQTYHGSDQTTFFVYHSRPGVSEPRPIAMSRPVPASQVGRRAVDLGVVAFFARDGVPFKSARVVVE